MKKIIKNVASLLILSSVTTPVLADIVVFDKNETGFAIDGNFGGATGRQVYLWPTNTDNINQQWEETFISPNFYQYQKVGTDFCLDGSKGASEGQIVQLWRCRTDNQNQHWEKISTDGGTFRLKKRGFSFSIDCDNGARRRQNCFLSRSQDSDINQQFNFLSTSTEGNGNGDFGLNPNLEPWQNFDLRDWALDAPNRDPEDNLSARTSDRDFANGDLFPGSDPYFFTGPDGAMVFKSPIGGARTSSNTSFPRSELREMLRSGDTSIRTTGVTENNWALGYQPRNDDIGAREGTLTATLSVNQVTSTGDRGQVGRVIIGQIHADNDEPLRLYYRKLPNNELGGIYFVHEIRDGDDLDHFNLIGSSSSSASNPSNGIALDEIFSYEIINKGSELEVIIRRGDRDGPIIGSDSIDMERLNSGYDRRDEWMYFKAGAYTQNNSGDEDDYDQVSFYRLDNSH